MRHQALRSQRWFGTKYILKSFHKILFFVDKFLTRGLLFYLYLHC